MKRICVLLFLFLHALTPFKSACGLHEVTITGGNDIAKGYVDSYETIDHAVRRHDVWLYTRASCDSIRWTLGEKTHSEMLMCGTAVGFMGVPEGVHHVVIEGCGKRIAVYLSVKNDLHVMIEPADLNAEGSCGNGGSPGEGGSYTVDFVESLSTISLISQL